jgi:NAD(P)-dependent dehydrogenase (short-subunit alcohol dehydrogenase family)
MATWFITGASRGLGAAIARHALDQGDDVVATARRPAAVTATLGESQHLLAVALDVTDEQQVQAAVQAAVDRFGRIDVVVNNAGRGLVGALEEITDAEARDQFDVNVFGTMNVIRAVLPTLRAQGSGAIVNLSSTAGLAGGPGSTMYNATKFAVEGITEGLREELAPFGVRVMVVEPGAFRTDFLDDSSLQLPATSIEAYDGTPAHDTVQWCLDNNHAQHGDPAKLAALLYDAATGPEVPLRVPVGWDAVRTMEHRIAANTAQLAAWRDRALATSHDT